ncbi:MAG TPA: alpha-galactosidase [Candidatus Limnocylindrales bacterium]|nr:alpha-galactosidase [Candidatus Limnocylindrales bacterium]
MVTLTWQAGPATATARLIAHEGGVVIECELTNPTDEPVTFNAWQPMVVDASRGGRLTTTQTPWDASVLINGFQSWDYAGVHALDDSLKDPQRTTHHSWWTAAVYGRDRNSMFVAQVLKASRFATVVRWRYHRAHQPDGLAADVIPLFTIEQHGAPLSQPEQRTGMPEPLQLEVPARSGIVSDPVLILYGEDGTRTLRRALRLAGEASGRAAFASIPRGWCSWYHLGLAVTESDVQRHAAFVARRLPQLRPGRGAMPPVIQVDDGWMPRWQRWGDWVANPEQFPSGLKALARGIRRHRLAAGIWLAPFHVAADSTLAREHPDWLVHRHDGELLVDPRLNRAYHILDATHEQAQAHLVNVFRGLRRDGFRYFKIDFLYGGAYEGRRARTHVTGIEALRIGLKRIHDAVNPAETADPSFILGCGAPLMPIVGLVHGCRTGGDVGAPQIHEGHAGDPIVGFPYIIWMARNQAARVFLDRTLYAVDADVALVNPQLSLDEARVMITVAALSGGVYLYSDDLERLPPERLALLRNPNVLALVGGEAAEPHHLFRAPDGEAGDHWFSTPDALPPVWSRTEADGTLVAAVYNWSGERRIHRLAFADLSAHPGAFRLRDLWSRLKGGRDLGVHRGAMRLTLPPHSVRLLRMEPVADPST